MPIDLRSDTVTLPSRAMREAMASAEVGDDVFGEDPTIARLEERIAELAGKDAAIFVASGTMGNLVSLLAHAGRGGGAILGDESHVLHYEAGGGSALGGIVFQAVPTQPDGTLPLAAIEGGIRSATDVHATPTAVICLENTHNRCGGVVLAPQYFASVASIASRAGLPVHHDGARLFNAAVAMDLPITAWTQHVTTVNLCLSKGLAAPVGSVVAGPRELVGRVRRMRKMLGGGMRQVGVLGAAGLVAVDQMVGRLQEDHDNARRLAQGLAHLSGIVLDLASVQTNIVVFHVNEGLDATQLIDGLKREGVLISNLGGGRLRAVTHYGIGAEDCDRAIAACARVLDRAGAGPLARAQSIHDALDGRR
jgi:threonine aldolase